MSLSIRAAVPADAAAIVAVAESVWPDESFDGATIERLIAEASRATVVARLDSDIVGFADGFLTRTHAGDARWEVDLLAVSPRAQGQRIGRTLVRASVDAAVGARAVSARALVRVGNRASEHVFAAAGFVVQGGVRQLWTSDSLSLPADIDGMHLVPVETFRYSGVWLEAVTAPGLHSLGRAAIPAVLGAVIPIDDQTAIHAARLIGLRPEGEFRFWERELNG